MAALHGATRLEVKHSRWGGRRDLPCRQVRTHSRSALTIALACRASRALSAVANVKRERRVGSMSGDGFDLLSAATGVRYTRRRQLAHAMR